MACPRCGTSNLAQARYCITCGTPLAVSVPPAQPSVAAGPQPPPHTYYAYTAAYWENQRAGRIDNTKTGLLLLMIGLLIAWIPFIGAVGGIIALVGAVLVILGREVLGIEKVETGYFELFFFLLVSVF